MDVCALCADEAGKYASVYATGSMMTRRLAGTEIAVNLWIAPQLTREP